MTFGNGKSHSKGKLLLRNPQIASHPIDQPCHLPTGTWICPCPCFKSLECELCYFPPHPCPVIRNPSAFVPQTEKCTNQNLRWILMARNPCEGVEKNSIFLFSIVPLLSASFLHHCCAVFPVTICQKKKKWTSRCIFRTNIPVLWPDVAYENAHILIYAANGNNGVRNGTTSSKCSIRFVERRGEMKQSATINFYLQYYFTTIFSPFLYIFFTWPTDVIPATTPSSSISRNWVTTGSTQLQSPPPTWTTK